MAHWAEIDKNNIVVRVLVGNNDADDEGYSWLIDNLGGRWVKTSYNTDGGVHYDPETGQPSADQSKALRKNYAAKGYVFDEARDAFIPPTPFPSWILNEDSCKWEPPVPYPNDDKVYDWDESVKNWVLVPA